MMTIIKKTEWEQRELQRMFTISKNSNKKALLNRFSKVFMPCSCESHSKLMADLGKILNTSGKNVNKLIAIENVKGLNSHVIDAAVWELAINDIRKEMNIDLRSELKGCKNTALKEINEMLADVDNLWKGCWSKEARAKFGLKKH